MEINNPLTVSALKGILYSGFSDLRASVAFKTNACASPIVSLSLFLKDILIILNLIIR